MTIEQTASHAATPAGCVSHLRIEYFRDGILIKACPSHGSKDDAITAARQGVTTYNAELAIIRDCDAGNVEVARLER